MASNNAKRLEKCLLKFCEKIEGNPSDDPVEIAILKKHKIATEEYYTKPVKTFGYKPSDFRKVRYYKPDPFKMPFCGSDFEEA